MPTPPCLHNLDAANRSGWQHSVAFAIVHIDDTSPADALHLLTAWPVVRSWAMHQDPARVNRTILSAYLRDALAWSGYVGEPSALLATAPTDTPASGETKAVHPRRNNATAPAATTGPEPSVANALMPTAPSAQSGPDSVTTTRERDGQTRPAHFDQYRDIVPAELQERFDLEISDLYLQRQELGARRDKLAEVVEQAMSVGDINGEEAASAMLAETAQQLVSADATLRHFWALVDVAVRHYQLNGEVMSVADLTAAAGPIVAKPKGTRRPRTKEYTKAEIEEAQRSGAWESAEVETATAERIRKNKQFLRDRRKYDLACTTGGKAQEEYARQMLLRADELRAWGVGLSSTANELLAAIRPDIS